MSDKKKKRTAEEILESSGMALFKSIFSLVSSGVFIFQFFASIFIIIMFHDMYPEIFSTFVPVIVMVLGVIWIMIKACFCIGLILLFISMVLPFVKVLIKDKKKRDKERRKKFIKELAKEIKAGGKKRG